MASSRLLPRHLIALIDRASTPFIPSSTISSWRRRTMSYRPPDHVPSAITSTSSSPLLPIRKKVTLAHLLGLHRRKIPITVLTAYDYPTALLLSTFHAPQPASSSSSTLPPSSSSDPTSASTPTPTSSPPNLPLSIDVILIGDSLSQVSLGHPSTTSLTLNEIIHHAQAVTRATSLPLTPQSGCPFLIVDVPFGTFEASTEQGVLSAIRLVKEAGVDCVKIEGGREILPLVRHLSSIGIPVMPHIGLTPQRAVALSGYKVQGRTAEGARDLVKLAKEMEEAGASSLLLEAIPSQLGQYITERSGIPTIGIGAGSHCSGQVLVLTDALGIYEGGGGPKFVRRFAEVGREMRKGVEEYVKAVRERSFPEEGKETYKMGKGEWERFIGEEGEEKK